MKKLTTTLPILFFILISVNLSAQTWSQKRSVEAYAEVNKSEPSITLKWETEAKTDSFLIYKRSLGSDNWGTAIAGLSPSATEYKDNDVTVGTIYEYRILRIGTDKEPLSSNNSNLESYSFISAGIELDVKHFRGEMLLLTSRLVTDSLSSELDVLMMDLVGDGWHVTHMTIEDNDSVPTVKAKIKEKYESEEGLHAIFLLGHIPVPYSGTYCDDNEWTVPPDGHGSTDPNSHCGAWPADLYYGSFAAEWPDAKTALKGKRAENQNNPGDGKFDLIMLQDSVDVPVGRVDMSSLTKFSESEVELTRRYLNKLHAYKSTSMMPVRAGIIEDNFSPMSEGFASGAWRDFYAILGQGSIVQADLFTTTRNADYLFNYVCGAGSYQSCNGLGNTDSFTLNNPAVFNHMFGSFFGDFDIANNIGRASLAAPGNGLIWVWSGRPKWVTHTLAIGETMGECALRTQNCNWNYGVSFFQNQAHVGLLGDPSLRAAMFQPVTDLTISSFQNDTRVQLQWTASAANDVTGYYIYWSKSENGPYLLLNETVVTGNSFIHYTPEQGTNYYMVRAERLEVSGSGSYYNLSLGQFTVIENIQRTASAPVLATEKFSLYPVPAVDQITLRFADHADRTIVITDIRGQVVMELNSTLNSVNIDVTSLASGMYIATVNGQGQKFIISRD